MLFFQLNGICSESFDIVLQISIVSILAHDYGFVSFVIHINNFSECIFVFVVGKKIGRNLPCIVYFNSNKSIF